MLSPFIEIIISETPPASHSVLLKTCVCQPCLSAYLIYILAKSPAKMLASSPPAPPLISSIISLSSIGSRGRRRTFILSSYSGSLASFSAISAFKKAFISSSDSACIISLASSIESIAFFHS